MTFDFNTIIGISGTILGLFGIIISIYSYRKSKKTKRLAVNSESNILISETLSQYESLKVSYNDENIKSLTSTIVRIKNIGSDIIEPSDIVPSSPIIIKTTQKFLFNDISQYKIVSSNSKNIIKLIKINDSSLQVSFDFLNPKNEIYITILHTGDISVDGDLKTGSIKNYTAKKYYDVDTDHHYDEDTYSHISSFKIPTLVLSIFSMFIACFSLFTNSYSIERLSPALTLMLLSYILLFQTRK